MKIISIISILISSTLFAQTHENLEAKKSAADKVIYMITELEKADMISNYVIDAKWPSQIACLSDIIPKAWNGTYIGVVFSPTLEEIQLWKIWFEKFKNKLTFGKDSSEILFEFEEGKFRTNKCQYN